MFLYYLTGQENKGINRQSEVITEISRYVPVAEPDIEKLSTVVISYKSFETSLQRSLQQWSFHMKIFKQVFRGAYNSGHFI